MATKVTDGKGRVRWTAPKRKAPISFSGLDPRAIAQRVRASRLAFGWSVRDLARVAGVAVGCVTKIEGGARVPRIDIACRVALAVGKSTDFLLLGRGARRRANADGLKVADPGFSVSGTNTGSALGSPGEVAREVMGTGLNRSNRIEPAGQAGAIVAPAPGE